MILNKGQEEGRKKLKKWWKSSRQVFKLVGYGGTGKTTIAHTLISELGLDIYEEVLFVTYVGKATLPLRRQGLPAKTIHSTCYTRVECIEKDENGKAIILPNGRYKKKGKFVLRDYINSNIKLIVVDEAGLIPKNMSDDLKSFGIKIIAIGDDGQLPPIFGKSEFLENPDHILTEVMRQKKGDPILFLADLARRGEEIPIGKYGDRCFVVDESLLLHKQIYTKPNIVLCGRNKTRQNINDIVRYEIMKCKDSYPVIGDKLMCRKNNWDIEIDDIALINGLSGFVTNVDDESFNGKSLNIDFMPDCLDGQTFDDIEVDYRLLSEPIGKSTAKTMYPYGNVFEYGYAATTHLAQGSQFGYVMMINEQMGNTEFQKRFLYTGITRAVDTLVLVQPKRRNNSYFF